MSELFYTMDLRFFTKFTNNHKGGNMETTGTDFDLAIYVMEDLPGNHGQTNRSEKDFPTRFLTLDPIRWLIGLFSYF